MAEFVLGVVAGTALTVAVVRRYLNREGKVADTIRRAIGVFKEH